MSCFACLINLKKNHNPSNKKPINNHLEKALEKEMSIEKENIQLHIETLQYCLNNIKTKLNKVCDKSHVNHHVNHNVSIKKCLFKINHYLEHKICEIKEDCTKSMNNIENLLGGRKKLESTQENIFVMQNLLIQKENESIIYQDLLKYIMDNKAMINYIQLVNPKISSNKVTQVLQKIIEHNRNKMVELVRNVNAEEKRGFDLKCQIDQYTAHIQNLKECVKQEKDEDPIINMRTRSTTANILSTENKSVRSDKKNKYERNIQRNKQKIQKLLEEIEKEELTNKELYLQEEKLKESLAKLESLGISN